MWKVLELTFEDDRHIWILLINFQGYRHFFQKKSITIDTCDTHLFIYKFKLNITLLQLTYTQPIFPLFLVNVTLSIYYYKNICNRQNCTM